MPGHVRLTDICSGHPCFPARANSVSSPDTNVNNIPATRFSDTRPVHCCGPTCHAGTNIGTHNVFVNNLMSQTCGDPVDCGSTQVMCSPDTNVN